MIPILSAAFGSPPVGFTLVKGAKMENAKLGDVIMVKCGSSGKGSSVGYYHAGVYCSEEDEEIIHFTLILSTQSGSSSWSTENSSKSSGKGAVSKVHWNEFCENNIVVVFRKDGGIPTLFKSNVKEAMKTPQEYNLFTNNCIHFAMRLLNVDSKNTEDHLEQFLKPKKNQDVEMQPLK